MKKKGFTAWQIKDLSARCAKCTALSSSFAFTLAEVLITLAIIGTVAALTIPSVIRSYQEQQYKTAFRKAYREATQAWNMALAENPDVFTQIKAAAGP